MAKVVMVVSNDLFTDQRVLKMGASIAKLGHEVWVWGRRMPRTPIEFSYPHAHRLMRCFFHRGAAFYAELNIRFFFRLLFIKFDVLHANDLDTLPAARMVARLRRKPLVYDAHEYFTEVPEIQNKPFVKWVWKSLEALCLPGIKYAITVNESIARLYFQRYGIEFKVVRNLPLLQKSVATALIIPDDWPRHKWRIMLQGNGLNVNRGGEEVIEAMQYVQDALLIVVGQGDALDGMKALAANLKLSEKILFLPRMPYQEMMRIARCAHIGISMDKDTNINYRFSLPNKLFDYLSAGLAVVASPLVEVRKVVEAHRVGVLVEAVDAISIATKINYLLQHPEVLADMQRNAQDAAKQLCWENEEAAIKEIYNKIA